jgi:hypothetical protein
MRTTSCIIGTILLAAVVAFGQSGTQNNGVLVLTTQNKGILEIRTPNNLGCSIQIKTWPQKSVEVRYIKHADARSREKEQQFLDLIDIRLDDNASDPDGLRLRVLAPTKSPWEGKDFSVGLELEIKVPANFKIDSKNSYSEIAILGPLSGLVINNEYGKVKAEDIKGVTIIKTSYSDVEIIRSEGDIDIETSYSKIRAERLVIGDTPALLETSYGAIILNDIKGSIEANTSYESIRAADIDAGLGSVILRTSYGPISANNITGELVCETSYNPVDLSGISFTHGLNSVETRYSPISIELSKIDDAQLVVNNTYSNINMILSPEISARVILAVDKGGKIHTRGFPIKPVVMEKNRLEGIIGDGRARVELNIDGIGEINIEGR